MTTPMKPLLIVLDDWENRIRQASCWKNLEELVEIKFLDLSIEKFPDSKIEPAEILLAIRERTTLNEKLFKRLPNLKLLLQTGSHAYHIDMAAACRRNIIVSLGNNASSPQVSVPELTFAFMLGLVHKVYQGNSSLKNGDWKLFTGQTLSSKRLGILGIG